MAISLMLVREILKLFVVMIMGYIIVTVGLLKSSDSHSISVIMAYLINPCVILNAYQVDYTPEIRDGLILAFIAAIAAHILFLLLSVLARRFLNMNVIDAAVIVYPNAGILVIPLVQGILGSEYVIYSSAFLAIQMILLWTHCKMMLCGERSIDWKRILLNPNILSIAAGILMFCLRVSFPADVQDLLDDLGGMIGPMGMLLAGMVIAEMPVRAIFMKPRNYIPTVMRLIICPLFALVLMKIMVVSSSLVDAKSIILTVYLACITPSCAMITTLAQLYHKDAGYASSLYVLSTLLSIVTMPVMVGIYDVFV